MDKPLSAGSASLRFLALLWFGLNGCFVLVLQVFYFFLSPQPYVNKTDMQWEKSSVSLLAQFYLFFTNKHLLALVPAKVLVSRLVLCLTVPPHCTSNFQRHHVFFASSNEGEGVLEVLAFFLLPFM